MWWTASGRVIETVNDLDNVMYEVACESGPETTGWQYHIIELIRQEEAKMPKQHLIGMSSDGGYVKGDDTERLFDYNPFITFYFSVQRRLSLCYSYAGFCG